MWKETPEGIILTVKVIPKSSRNEIIGWEENSLRIRIAAVPEKGNANEALIAFLAKTLGIGKTHITLISGTTSRQKRLRIEGVSSEILSSLLPKHK